MVFMMTSKNYAFSPIATITTPFKQKFAIPRQPGLANAKGTISFLPGFDDINMLEGIDGFSHLWLLFIFHQTQARGWKSKVKAPRLGGNASTGVLATRSTHRPNSVGMSVVLNKGVVKHGDSYALNVEGVDLVDGTPIIDIKPYLPYADAISGATDKLSLYHPIPQRTVQFDSVLSATLEELEKQHGDFKSLATSVLSQDPRPAYKHQCDNDPKTYKVALYNVDLSFIVLGGCVRVTQINPL
jgi:tRNA-Thr(GGU) m(6)t(6)A37 methyltransferase TsaA